MNMPEVSKPNIVSSSIPYLAALGSLLALSQVGNAAFTRGSRDVIRNRDKVCTRCGTSDHLESAHINHNKGYHKYDDPSNGRLLCTEDHLEDHINRHGRNGLTKNQNKWAIRMIKKRLGLI